MTKGNIKTSYLSTWANRSCKRGTDPSPPADALSFPRLRTLTVLHDGVEEDASAMR